MVCLCKLSRVQNYCKAWEAYVSGAADGPATMDLHHVLEVGECMGIDKNRLTLATCPLVTFLF